METVSGFSIAPGKQFRQQSPGAFSHLAFRKICMLGYHPYFQDTYG
jgi:hypothetical protein